MTPLELVKLPSLMERTSGRSELKIGLIDGPVALNHPDLTIGNIREISRGMNSACTQTGSSACVHGTFVAGILTAKRGSVAPAICPGCTLLVRPIFAEAEIKNDDLPSATPGELATAILDCINAGAQVVNVSASLAQPSIKSECALEESLDYAAQRGVIVIVAAGNQGTLGSTAITRHPWVIPVVAYDLQRNPMDHSNMGNSIGRRGLGAPGENVTSLGSTGQTLTLGGTSAAAPFVTGAIALLWSALPSATAAQVKFAIVQAYAPRRATVVPPLLNAWGSYQFLMTTKTRR
ncbi:MAG: peptidase S8 [Candidatus Brocadia sp. WS118]|nr:MAG: peptidase S8 [Candidatus Brocadia sp. WS118]